MATPSPMSPPPDPLVPANIGGWFEKVVGTIRRSFTRLLMIQVGLTVVIAVVIAIFDAIAASRGLTPGTATLSLGILLIIAIFTSLAQIASFIIATLDAAGESTSVDTAIRLAKGRVFPLVGWSIIAGSLTMIGFVLFVIPGIYLAIVFGASLIGVVTVERRNIGRCFQLVHQRFWPTTGRMLLAFLIFITCFAALVGIEYVAGPGSVVNSVLGWIFSIIMGLFGVGVSVVTYAELRFHENPTMLTPTLAGELRR